MTVRQRSINGDEMRLRPQLQIYPAANDAGFGPYMPDVAQGAPVPTELLYDRLNDPILDRAGVQIETRM
jgi:hypothetical protein